MTIEEFVNLFKTSTNPKMTCEKRIVTKYVRYEEKVAICQSIIKNTTRQKIGDTEIYKQNTPAQYVLFSLELVNLYTDIDIDFAKVLDCFNALDEVGAIDAFLEAIPQKEYEKFKTILHMMLNDQYEEERSLVGYIDGKIQVLNTMIDSIKDTEGLPTEIKKALNSIK